MRTEILAMSLMAITTASVSLHAQNRIVTPNSFARSSSPLGFEVEEFTSENMNELAASLMFGGCVEVSNVQIHGPANAFGTFTDDVEATGIDEGLILTTGKSTYAEGPDNMNDRSHNQNTGGLADLTQMCGYQTHDACWIEFDFVALADTLFASEFVFGSEEYPEYVNSSFNDVFGFFISGPGIYGPYENGAENIALLPGTQTSISINNVNNGYAPYEPSVGPCENCDFYVDNSNGQYVQYDGYTSKISLEYPVISGETYHFRIAIADAGDHVYDSGVFIRNQSLCGNTWDQTASFIANEVGTRTFDFENHSQNAEYYFWDFGDGYTSVEQDPTHIYDVDGAYEVSLTCSNQCFDTTMTMNLNVGMITEIEELISIEASLLTIDRSSLKLTGSLEQASTIAFDITDLMGRLHTTRSIGIGNQFNEVIDISGLSTGAYVLNLRTENSSKAIRFVKS